MRVPPFVASLTSGGGAVLVQASVAGAGAFLCNQDMAAGYVSAKEAEAAYGASAADPDAVMRRLVVAADRSDYLGALADLLVGQSSLESSASLVVRVHAKAAARGAGGGRGGGESGGGSGGGGGRRRGETLEQLCLLEMRCAVTPDGSAVCLGVKLTPDSFDEGAAAVVDPFLLRLGRAINVDLTVDLEHIGQGGGGGAAAAAAPPPNRAIRAPRGGAAEETDSDGDTPPPPAAPFRLGSPLTSSFDNVRAYQEAHGKPPSPVPSPKKKAPPPPRRRSEKGGGGSSM